MARWGRSFPIQHSVRPVQKLSLIQTLTKSLQYAVKTTPSAVTKSLKYTIYKTASALTKSLKYTIKVTPSALTKSLDYIIGHQTDLTKSLKYVLHFSTVLTKSLEYDLPPLVQLIIKKITYHIKFGGNYTDMYQKQNTTYKNNDLYVEQNTTYTDLYNT